MTSQTQHEVISDEENISEFWQTNPCGDWQVGGLEGRFAGDYNRFFTEYDAFRYRREGHILGCLNDIDFTGKKVLEIGLGQGAESEQIIRRGGRWSGLDLTQASVTRVKERIRLRNLPYDDLKVGSVLEIPYPDNSFDMVFSHGVLHHVPEIAQAQAEIARVLKPGGELVMMVYAKWSLNYLLAIGILRRAGLAAMMALGMKGKGIYAAHIRNAHEEGLFNYLRMKTFIHRSTDGPDNPYAKVYGLPEVRKDVPDFVVTRSYKRFMHAPPLPVKWMPLQRMLGWHLWVHLTARKNRLARQAFPPATLVTGETMGAITEISAGSLVDRDLSATVSGVVDRFSGWLENFGETSLDFQTVYASPIGRAAKALYYRNRKIGTIAVAPMVFCEAFTPRARRYFWKRQRFPIADAHYAMAFAFLASARGEEKWLDRARHFLSVLEATRCPGLKEYGWGYPFDWETMYGTIPAGTPLITTTPYVYEAFSQVYGLDHDPRWLAIMESIAHHAFTDYRDLETGFEAASCSYTPSPSDPCLVVNASAYRAFLLAKAGIELAHPQYVEAAKRNIRFVASAQNADGSWPYAVDGRRAFVDHYHTCFVMKSLTKASRLIDSPEAERAIERGIQYYLANLFDETGLPRPFARPPRLITYRRELYDYAECVNLAVLLRDRFPALNLTLSRVVNDLSERWQRQDGSFRSRQLLFGWDHVPMHRWAQAQTFRGLCFLLANGASPQETGALRG